MKLDIYDPTKRTATQKPGKFASYVKGKVARQTRVTREQAHMQAAKRLDGKVCRYPKCEFRALKLPIDPAHLFGHRKMGGDKTGHKTHRKLIGGLCRGCHNLYDEKRLRAEALDPTLKADGRLAWYRKHDETGKWQHTATDRGRVVQP